MNLSIKNIVCALASMAFFFCSNDYNPFMDPSNARVLVTHKSFRDIDTIGIFATETLMVVVSARDLVDSFSIAATNNRLFTDTIIRAHPASVIPPTAFTLYLSFADTGWQKVTVNTFRKNDDKVSMDYSLYCTSPLHQDSVLGAYSDSIQLKTNPVADADVMYHWDFGDGTIVEKSKPNVKVLMTTFLSGKTGSLWVSDNSEKNNSPKTLFSFLFNDPNGPIIVCINDNVRNDTVQTGDSTFTFLARIIELQNIATGSVAFNGQPCDFSDADKKVYVKIFNGVAGHQAGSPLAVRIEATDMFNNLSEKTYYVVYNAAIGRRTGPEILVKSPSLDLNNIATSSTEEKLILGSVENYSSQPFEVLMRLRVNGVLQSKIDTLPAAYSGLWTFNTSLNVGANQMTVIAYKSAGDSCAGQSFIVIYDPATLKNDTTPPVILDISTGDSQNFYTTKDSIVLRIIAVDEGTGIRTMLVNGVSVNSNTEGKGFIWYDAIKAFHSKTEGLIRIIASDSNNNSTDTFVHVYKNRLPQIVRPLFPSNPLVAGTTYRDAIVIFDPDTDTVRVTKVSGPAGLTVYSNGSVEWTPAASDTGLNPLAISLFDGFQTKMYLCSLFVAVSSGTPEQPVLFVTTSRDFPAYLEAGKDSMKVTLQTVNGTAPLLFGAMVRTTNSVLPVQDNTVQWKPALVDTGWARLMVTVSDARKKADTLFPEILVIPPNRPFSLSMSQTAPLAADGSLDMSKATGPDTLRFTIQDPDDPLVERHTLKTIQSHSETVTALDSSRSFMVILDPSRVAASLLKDTIEVIVTDRAGHADTVTYGVVYHTVIRTKKIQMNTASAGGGAAVSAAVTKFPLLVRLDKTNFDFSAVNKAGSPLGFNKPDGSPLPFEIERWDSGGGQAEIWVLVDTVFGSDSAQFITMNWDLAGAAPRSNGAAVFDTANGFQGVWHFGEGTNSVALDATRNTYNGVPNGSPIDTTGVIGHAKVFNGQTSYFTMPGTASGKLNFPRGGPYTISAWVNTDVLDGNYYTMVSKGNFQYMLQIANDNQWELMDFDDRQGWTHVRSPAAVQTWKYVVGVANGATMYLYVDGKLASNAITIVQASGRDVSNNVIIGKRSDVAERFFNGKIDEVCMANVQRSADWIKLCYANQRPGSGFITFK